MLGFIKKIFPSKKEKDVRDLEPIAALVNEEYKKLRDISDDELRGLTTEFKGRIKAYTSEIDKEIETRIDTAENELSDISAKEKIYEEIDQLKKKRNEAFEEIMDELLPEAFAVVKETARRLTEHKELVVTANDYDKELAETRPHIVIEGDTATYKNEWDAAGAKINWNMIHYDVQIMGGAVLHKGKIAEMATGEGKTLVATFPVYLNAITGMGVHLVTVNNYLARRDAEWNAPIFQFHGLTVDCIDLHEPNTEERRKAYGADITYGTNNEFGFDYLRDNMTTHPEYLVQRPHFFSIIDEIDSVLIDEARTPLIISGPVPRGDKHEYNELKPRIEKLVREQRKLITQYLTDAKKQIQKEERASQEEAGLNIFRAFRGLPKYDKLIEFLSEQGVTNRMRKTEGFYLQDNSKQLHLADEPLYFTIDQKNNQVELTDKGRELITRQGEDADLFVLPDVTARFSEIAGDTVMSEEEKVRKKDVLAQDFAEKSERLHAINQLLKAYTLFDKDVEYIMENGKVMIVDEQTGRVLSGRRYSDGLHQAIEAKENVKIESATQTFATVTLQNYFRMYHKLCGMTGTAETEEGEFFEIYKLDVVVIPTNRPIVRDDREDLVYKTRKEKYQAVVDEIAAQQEKGRPILVGTTSVEVSEHISRLLHVNKIEHAVLNAKQHQREADIVAAAGEPGAVTVATNMAGRGTDIKLGKGVIEAGGLAIIGTERHESRRIDRQLRGRAGRQGDPGMSQFYVSLEDELMRLFGSERIAKIMDRIGLKEGEVIQHSMITKSIGNAQKKVEENNFAMRKRLLEYDDVMNNQREVVYRRRRNALYGDRIKVDLDNMLYDLCNNIVERHFDFADAESLQLDCIRMLAIDPQVTERDLNDESVESLSTKIYDAAKSYYKRKIDLLATELERGIRNIKEKNNNVERILIPFSDGNREVQIVVNVEDALNSNGQAVIDELEKVITLRIIDDNWKTHLREMDELRQSVQNAVFEQKDPLLVYKFESFELFQQVLSKVNVEVLSTIFKADLQIEGRAQQQSQQVERDDFSGFNTQKEKIERQRQKDMDQERRVMAGASEQSDRKLSRNERRSQERKKPKRRIRGA
ncbi:preprotein translocase subunit SecA [bacterium]|nr:preprotein translocase subunit SecA [bacterium]